MFAFFLSSGLFLGWSLGANDASNVFGTAVGTRMIRFRTAAICCAVFIVLGAVIGGAGTSATLGKLGEINAIAGAFVVALAAGAGVYLMTKAGYPVSTSQTIVGAIIGWNVFSGSLTDYHSLTKIVSTWVACPILSAAISIVLYKLVSISIRVFKPHMFHLDALTRYALLVVGAFGSYSLGANNIANVMGVFLPVAPFPEISLFGWLAVSPAQQLFFIGGLAIATGVLTYSRHVMMTVGEGIMRLSPVAAFVVVSAHSLVLFLFSSEGINEWLTGYGLPAIPLVPVSSSQAIVGAVIGIGLLKGGRAVQWRVLRGISLGWVITPLIAGVISFIALFFFQNVSNQQTYRQVSYSLTHQALDRIGNADINTALVSDMANEACLDAVTFRRALNARIRLTWERRDFVMDSAKLDELTITKKKIESITADGRISKAQAGAVGMLEGRTFVHPWLLNEALAQLSPEWRMTAGEEKNNRKIAEQFAYLYSLFRD
jgi:inorganic phosphate transporter, PiT family